MFGLFLAFSPRCLSSKSVPFRALALFPMSASCQTFLELAMSCAPPVPSHNHPATPSYLYRPNSNNWFHELLLHVSLGMKVPGHRLKLLSDVRKPAKTKKREREEEEGQVKGEGRAQKLQDEDFGCSWQQFIHRLGRNQGPDRVKNPPRLKWRSCWKRYLWGD